jgi:hypothetical protein
MNTHGFCSITACARVWNNFLSSTTLQSSSRAYEDMLFVVQLNKLKTGIWRQSHHISNHFPKERIVKIMSIICTQSSIQNLTHNDIINNAALPPPDQES